MRKRRKLNKEKLVIACKMLGKNSDDYSLLEGYYYRMALSDEEFEKVCNIYNSLNKIEGKVIKNKGEEKEPIINKQSKQEAKDLEEFKKYKEANTTNFEYYKIDSHSNLRNENRYAIALLSDIHLEETVIPSSVLGLNEYNVSIAEKRVLKYFENLTKCLIKDKVETLILSMLGDNISGFIHDELPQCNGLTPPDAILKCQSLLVSGLKHIIDNCLGLKIKCIMINGNHGRVTKKIQHSNGFKMSYEWIMYNNIKSIFDSMGYKNIEFIIPESELALLEMQDGNRFIFIHGYQIKSGGTGTVCGIYPSLQRLAMKWDRVFHQTKIYLGHFHSCVSIPTATVNGSIIGYNAFALSNGFSCEEPAQMYELYGDNKDLLLTRKIYCK